MNLPLIMVIYKFYCVETYVLCICVIVCVCMCVCMRTCMHAYMHACVRACMPTCMHAYVHACVRARMRTYVHAYVRACNAYVHACVRACMHTYMHAYVHACVRACMRTCVHACVGYVCVRQQYSSGQDVGLLTEKYSVQCSVAAVCCCIEQNLTHIAPVHPVALNANSQGSKCQTVHVLSLRQFRWDLGYQHP